MTTHLAEAREQLLGRFTALEVERIEALVRAVLAESRPPSEPPAIGLHDFTTSGHLSPVICRLCGETKQPWEMLTTCKATTASACPTCRGNRDVPIPGTTPPRRGPCPDCTPSEPPATAGSMLEEPELAGAQDSSITLDQWRAAFYRLLKDVLKVANRDDGSLRRELNYLLEAYDVDPDDGKAPPAPPPPAQAEKHTWSSDSDDALCMVCGCSRGQRYGSCKADPPKQAEKCPEPLPEVLPQGAKLKSGESCAGWTLNVTEFDRVYLGPGGARFVDLFQIDWSSARAPNHPCKRCGKPVAHPVQEYCGAACSARRKEPYPQPDEATGTADPPATGEGAEPRELFVIEYWDGNVYVLATRSREYAEKEARRIGECVVTRYVSELSAGRDGGRGEEE